MCSARRAAFLIFAALAWLFFRGIGDHGLLDPLEGIDASVAMNMRLYQNFTAPRIEDLPYQGTSVGYWRLAAWAMRSLGEFEFGARFWSAVGGLGMAAMSCLIARRTGGELAGNYAAVLTGSSLLTYAVSQLATPHALYACLVNAALLGVVCGFRSRRFFTLTHASAVLALIVYGPAGWILPWLSFLLYAYIAGEERFFLRAFFYWPGFLTTLLLGAGYLVFLNSRNPVLLTWMGYNFPAAAFSSFPSALAFLAVGYFPWLGAFPEALKNAIPLNRHFIPVGRKKKLLPLVWGGVFLFAGLFARDALLLAAPLPALASFCALRLAELVERGNARRFQWIIVLKILSFAILFFIVLPLIYLRSPQSLWFTLQSVLPWGGLCIFFLFAGRHYAKKRNPRKLMLHLCWTALLPLLPLAGLFDLLGENLSIRNAGFYIRTLDVKQDDVFVQYSMNHPSMYFYTGRKSLRIHASTTSRISGEEVLDEAALHRLWEGSRRVFLLMRRNEWLRPLPSGAVVYNLYETSGYILLSNRAE